MCSWIVASVPIPFLSIFEIRSDSLSGYGAEVLPFVRSRILGMKVSFSVNGGSSLSDLYLNFSFLTYCVF